MTVQMPRYRIVSKTHVPTGMGEVNFCAHCGRTITHLYSVEDTQTGKDIGPLGSGCVVDVTGLTPSGIALAWAEYEAEIQDEEIELTKAKKAKEWFVVNQALADGLEALASGAEHYCPVAEEMLENVVKFGSLTEKQMNLFQKLVEKAAGKVSRDDYFNANHLAFFMLIELKLGLYDKKFLDEMTETPWGYTIAQVDAIKKVAHKYRKQIGGLTPKALEPWGSALAML